MHTYNHTKGRAQAHTARGTGSYYFCVISLASGMHGVKGKLADAESLVTLCGEVK